MTNKKTGLKYSKILRSNWVVTLSATLIGVFAAMYLNEWVASRKLVAQKSIATENILAEFNSNNGFLKEALEKHEELLEIVKFLGQHTNKDDNLIASVEALNEFRVKYPDILEVYDSTYVKQGVYQYNGEINLNLSFPHFELTTITWNTLKSSGIISTFSFECLLHLETLNNITNEVSQKNKELLNYLTGVKDSGEGNQHLISHLKLLIEYEESLSNYYEVSEESLENCS
ncbi:MAG: hypothetical protein AAF990_12480 [Bacteroidota bacterium]